MVAEERNAFATLLVTDSYLLGAIALSRSLKASRAKDKGSWIPLVVLCTPDTLSPGTMDALHKHYDQVIAVPLIRSTQTENLELLGRPELE